jgi:hypothetical protein|tara:strand:- start:6026 stop:6301 length:276 start_codon:yes stop_codon:yes gene_type:complete
MSQYDAVVERQRQMMKAEEWSKGVKAVHAHSFTTMWYDNNPDRTGDDLRVIDVEYNDGTIEREYMVSGKKEIIGTRLSGQDLLDEFGRHNR